MSAVPVSNRNLAFDIARAIVEGFDRHYAYFRYTAQQTKSLFERRDWHAIQRMSRERLSSYDARVNEGVERLEREFGASRLSQAVWLQAKQFFVGLLQNHKRPELAETYFNSVATRILARDYFHNDYLFARPAVSTEHLDADPPAYRSYYPREGRLRELIIRLVSDFGLAAPYEDLRRDAHYCVLAARQNLPHPFRIEMDCQVQVLSSLFFRNKGAYVIGRIINGDRLYPFAVPILYRDNGKLYLDTMLFGADRIATLFGFSRAYFLVDMEVPAACVEFLHSLIPHKPWAELYTMLGLQKQGKTLFYRDFLHHLRHSHDQFVIAPGIRGLVMLVFTLPSYPYVFKIIKDKLGKDVTQEHIRGKYQLVKVHDRVGRMADIWEFSYVGFPRSRFAPELLAELHEYAPSAIEEEGDDIVIKHLYIERRITPLNIWIERANAHGDRAKIDHAIREYGDAIRQMIAANIFPGDMLYKNFGLTRNGRVVFYDYDEIQYITDCNFRRIPPAPDYESEMSGEPWYSVGPNDVFPEEFEHFLLNVRNVREPFMKYHAELLDAAFWNRHKDRILAGHLEDVFPYPQELRFSNAFAGPERPQRIRNTGLALEATDD